MRKSPGLGAACAGASWVRCPRPRAAPRPRRAPPSPSPPRSPSRRSPAAPRAARLASLFSRPVPRHLAAPRPPRGPGVPAPPAAAAPAARPGPPQRERSVRSPGARPEPGARSPEPGAGSRARSRPDRPPPPARAFGYQAPKPTKKHDGVKYCLPKFPGVGGAEFLNFLCQELDQIPFLKAKNRSICTPGQHYHSQTGVHNCYLRASSQHHAAAPAGPAGPRRLLGPGAGSWLRGAALGLLGRTHHPAGGHLGDGGDLRQGVREHRRRLRRGHRPVPLPRAGRLLLLLHGRQGAAQEPVGDAGAQPRRGAGAGLRRAAAARGAARRQPERHAAARLRRHGVAAAARRPAVRARRPRRHLQRLPGVRRRRRACARAARAPGAALGLLGGAHAQPRGFGRGPGAAAPAARLRHGARQHRRRLRRGGRRVPLPPAGRLLLLLHAGQAAAQDAVGEADEEPRRGAGHDLRRRRVAAPRDAEPERDAGAAARRRRLAAQPRPRRLRRLQQPRQVHHLLRLPSVPRPRRHRPAGPRAPGALSLARGGARGRPGACMPSRAGPRAGPRPNVPPARA
ncbi:complement C1q tumor necrosis factor-related protein 4 isoform X1 [Canis lupus dingo]|uniref:complement C1q tumor necrosis factor-related protein 4 isoform X1 n=1 Tax=Canis lupus dingo TaxID=286419 RepID=UPI0020C3FB36|nr:complement C1q tumor necrosis factor-related protein 4 isoform X1 [Canis lupus dingo]